MDVSEYFNNNGWTIVRDALRPDIPAAYEAPNKLPLSILSKRVLSNYKNGIYRHQYQALNAVLDGQNVCLTTSTASGKSLVFYIAGIELLSRNPTSTVLAIYPLKALTDEQETKWKQAMDQTGTKVVVGRIDGSVTGQDRRKKILRESSVVIMTPDVVHAWLLSNLGERSVINFLSKLQMIVIDEAHTYSGVFGSNSAYLFRRLSHLATKLGASPRFIAASATMNNPAKHLQNLTGQEFQVIAQNLDSSGRKASRLLMVEPPDSDDVFTSLTNLMQFVTRETDHQFITFVDSRKQTEQMASMMRRNLELDPDVEDIHFDMLERLQVHPFRAGYESSDRKRIQERLHEGSVRGVISTSALEMGIDLPWLTMGILYGIPYSATSYYQRVGRVGRHAEGTIIVVNNGSILSNRIFRQPESLDTMPLAESALYLENPRIQYIHAMCFARPGGEDDTVNGAGTIESEIAPFAQFPEAFLELSNRERVGEVGKAFQSMKAEAGNDPNHAFPLRDCEIQYQVEMKSSREPKALGSLSFSQVMREAYPGAVYYYHTQPYRVVKIQMREHTILVRPERRYTTNPILIPTLVYPNLSEGNVYNAMRYGDFWVVESNLQITETITGIKERRGPNESTYHYPLDPGLGLYFDRPKFERNYFSSGVIITHPAFAGKEISREMLASLIFEAFLMEVPFERQDLHAAHDQFRVSRGAIPKGQRFLCVYDQTYGSLRLTGRLMEPQILRGVLDKAVEIAANDSAFALNSATMSVLQLLRESVQHPPVQETLAEESPISLDNVAEVILPGSVGLYPDYRNEEFRVDDVVYTPKGLIYKGKRLSQQGARFEEVTVTAPVDKIVTIPGRSELGYYDFESGEILPLSSGKSPDDESDLIRITI